MMWKYIWLYIWGGGGRQLLTSFHDVIPQATHTVAVKHVKVLFKRDLLIAF